MADEPNDKGASGASTAAPVAAGQKSSLLPMIMGILVVLGIGGGAGFLAAGVLFGGQAEEKPKAETTPGTVIDAKSTKEIVIGDLITNIANQDGRRYVKVTCAVWISQEDAASILGSGGEGEIQIKRLMQMGLEEQLKRYELADLTGRGIIAALSQDFTVVLDDVLRAQFPDRPKDHRFIKRVLLNNLLVQ